MSQNTWDPNCQGSGIVSEQGGGKTIGIDLGRRDRVQKDVPRGLLRLVLCGPWKNTWETTGKFAHGSHGGSGWLGWLHHEQKLPKNGNV